MTVKTALCSLGVLAAPDIRSFPAKPLSNFTETSLDPVSSSVLLSSLEQEATINIRVATQRDFTKLFFILVYNYIGLPYTPVQGVYRFMNIFEGFARY